MKFTKYAPDWGRINWDISAPGIRCKLDSIGANVYDFEFENVRVLAHSREDAKEALMTYLQDEKDDD